MPRKSADQPLEHPVPFNPLDKASLGKSVAEAFLASNLHPIPPEKRFSGAGVYALYYFGKSQVYKHLVERRAHVLGPVPIYIGKAVPSGGRKGNQVFDASQGYSLNDRLRHHANSIKQTTNLDINDFQCRYLVVDDVWIPLGESLLIRQFRPLWNVIVEGFGNNPTGGPRKTQKRSPWDTLHPGRSGVGEATEETIKREQHLREKIHRHLEQE